MPSTDQDLLAKSRSYSTDAERTVLALESIADQLRLLVARLPLAEVMKGHDESVAKDAETSAKGAWENEGDILDTASLAALGIRHSVTDQFEVGAYRYTNLADAIAEASRLRTRMAS